MNIYRKAGSKNWYYDFWLDGKRHQKTTKTDDWDEAQNLAAAARLRLLRTGAGIDAPEKPARQTIGALLEALLRDYRRRGKDSGKNANPVKRVMADFGNIYSDTLTKKAIEDYIEKRQAERAANSTINHALQILISAFKLAELKFPKVPKLSEADAVRSGFFSDDEFRRVYNHLPEDLKDFALFGYLTGWRKGAISSLTHNDVHDGNVYLKGVCSKNKRPYFVPIIGELVDLIERRKQARAYETPDGIALSSFVFHRRGAPISEMRKAWASACRKAGCPERLFHDLRRTCARNLIRSGVTRNVAMKITGHKTEAMFERYNVTDEADEREAMAKLTKYHQAEQRKIVAIAR